MQRGEKTSWILDHHYWRQNCKGIWLFGIYVLLFGSCQTAIKTDHSSLERQIDSLFQAFNAPGVPGAAVGVIQHGALIFAKGYGSANLDYSIPNSPTSKFYIGSMAKQFCGAALLKLESEGKISFSDPIQKYLKDFPEYEHTITVDHIIHHTSGIRGTSSMQLIQGIDGNWEDHFTAGEQYELIKQQKELNFMPGTQYRYSSGGYIVLAKLVEEVSGMSFRAYLDKHLFQPLGMENTFVIDDHQEVVQGRVISYFPDGDAFKRRSMVFDGMGDGSILTTVHDLLAWDQAFYDDQLLGIPNFGQRMMETGKVRSRTGQFYGMALQSQQHNGRLMVAHNGGMLGFRADMVRFPEENVSVIVLANHAGIHSTQYALNITDLIFGGPTLHEGQPVPSPSSFSKDAVEGWVGKYFSEDVNQWRRISSSGDTLFYDAGSLEYRIPLKKINDKQLLAEGPGYSLKINRLKNAICIDFGWVKHSFIKFDDTQPQLVDLLPLTGRYFSEELNAWYHVYVKGERLMLQVNQNEPLILFPDPTDPRINWNSKDKVWIGYAMMKFQFNEQGQPIGFRIGDNRVKGILFQKVDEKALLP